MEELLQQLLNEMKDIKEQVSKIDHKFEDLSAKLENLEKMDSIEHRVTVNQIDLVDVKELVEKIESFQREELAELVTTNLQVANVKEEFKNVHRRLDAHLTKIAKNEEAILMIENRHLRN
ncbi:MAG: hypothetical protein ACE3JP_05555 [Ectobacillus sp.]